VEDGTNEEPCCTRNRLRLSVIPLLKELYPTAAQSAARCAGTLTQDEAYLRECAEDFLDREHRLQYGLAALAHPRLPARISPRTEALADLPDPVFARVLRQMLPVCPEKHHIDLIRDFCKRSVSGSALSLPGCTLTVEKGRLSVSRGKAQIEDYALTLREGEQEIPNVGKAILICGRNEKNIPSPSLHTYATQISLSSAMIQGDLVLRNRRVGDRLYQGRMHKTVRRLAGVCSLPAEVRARMPLLADDCGVLAVPFGRTDGSPLYRDGTDPKGKGDLTLYLFFD
jgi:tRNA(Ile)-lysidine synthase